MKTKFQNGIQYDVTVSRLTNTFGQKHKICYDSNRFQNKKIMSINLFFFS